MLDLRAYTPLRMVLTVCGQCFTDDPDREIDWKIGYTYGSLLGVFLVGLFTRGRGNDAGNGVAMIAGFVVVTYLSGLDKAVAGLVGCAGFPRPGWMPEIEFPWRIFFGTVATFAVAVCFRTPAAQIENTRAKNEKPGEPHVS